MEGSDIYGQTHLATSSPSTLHSSSLFFLTFPSFFILLGSFLDRVRWDGMIRKGARWLGDGLHCQLFSPPLPFSPTPPHPLTLFSLAPLDLSTLVLLLLIVLLTAIQFPPSLCFSCFAFCFFLFFLPWEMRSASKRQDVENRQREEKVKCQRKSWHTMLHATIFENCCNISLSLPLYFPHSPLSLAYSPLPLSSWFLSCAVVKASVLKVTLVAFSRCSCPLLHSLMYLLQHFTSHTRKY